jgi:FtsX-like permease family
MRAVVAVAAHELRTRWRAWVSMALLVAFAGGCVLTAAAGARRTGSAYQRFLVASKASDVLVSPAGTGLGGYYRALARLPGVAAVAPIVGLNVQPIGPGGGPVLASVAAAPLDRRWGHLLEIPKVLAGRLPLEARPGEIAVDQNGALALRLHVGSTLAMRAIPAGPSPGANAAHRPLLRERVVGIIVTRGSVHPVTNLDKIPSIFASTALLRRLGHAYIAFDGAYVKLQPGHSAGIAGHQAETLAQRFPATRGHVFVADESAQAAAIERSIRPEAVSLALFALVLAITALLVVGQAATRLIAAAQPANPVLAALGMTRGQLMAAGLLEVGVAAATGAAAAAGLAVAASPLMPIGTARLAEPDPGVSADAAVLTAGVAAIVVLAVARVAGPAWHLASSGNADRSAAAASAGRSKIAGWLAGADAPVTAAAGVRLALEPGRGRTAVPVRSALTGTALSVLVVIAALTFGANLFHLVHTPRLYGKTWDAAVDWQFGSFTPRQAEHVLGAAPGIAGWTFGNHGTVGIGGLVVPAIGVSAGRGPLLTPTILAGRPPRTGRELALGTATMRRIARTVGQTVTVTVGGQQRVDRIVGRAVFPNFGQGSFTPTDLGEGAVTTAAGLGQQAAGGPAGYEFALLRFARGPQRAAHIAAFRRSMSGTCRAIQEPACVVTDQRPNGVVDYARIDAVPEALAAVLAVLGLAVLGQFIVVSGRRRRRDFAILKALGLTRRQVRVITAWQVSIVSGLALAAGIPLGVAAGHWTWEVFAGSLGIPADFVMPLPLILFVVPAVILSANAVAFWPARAVARVSPARVLRAE